MAAGHQLVLNYLGVAPTAAPMASPAPAASTPAPSAAPGARAGRRRCRGSVSAPPRWACRRRDELLARLTAIVSARTGYPEDMLGPDLDVEADLSIDSIKRLEILGELADQIGLADDGSLDQLEDLVEELAARKTLRGIVAFLVEHEDRLGGPAPAPAPASTPVAAAPAAALPEPEELLARLTAIVSARTGYPEDMLGPDLDVEADLSIDSIKRLEILGELADQIGLADDGSLDQLEDLVEELAARKTLRGVVDFLFEHADRLTGGTGPAVPAPVLAAAETPAASSPAASSSADIPPVANRFTVVLTDEPLGGATVAAGLTVQVTGAGAVAARLVEELVARGVVAGAPGAAGNGSPSLVVVTDLLAADGEDGAAVTVPELYGRLRPLLLDTAADVLVVTPLGGGLGIDPPAPVPAGEVVPVGAGARGLVKTAALEFPDRRIRLVDVDPAADPATLARHVADEVAQADAPVEVAWRDGVRRAPEAVLRSEAAPTCGPAGAGLGRAGHRRRPGHHRRGGGGAGPVVGLPAGAGGPLGPARGGRGASTGGRRGPGRAPPGVDRHRDARAPGHRGRVRPAAGRAGGAGHDVGARRGGRGGALPPRRRDATPPRWPGWCDPPTRPTAGSTAWSTAPACSTTT